MRILIISDIHANLTAFESVMEDAKDQWDFVWCIGDVVGYGPDPNECVEKLRELPHLCLAGNHDWAVLEYIDIRSFNPDARRATEWTYDNLSESSIRWLKTLPSTYIVGEYTLVHASPREPIMEYIVEPLVAALNFSHYDTPFCIVGHTHQPVLYEMFENGGEIDARGYKPSYGTKVPFNPRSRLIVNPGSVGQPRDGDPRAAYAILDLDKNVFEHRRVIYDISAVQKRIHSAGLPERSATRLEQGW